MMRRFDGFDRLSTRGGLGDCSKVFVDEGARYWGVGLIECFILFFVLAGFWVSLLMCLVGNF